MEEVVGVWLVIIADVDGWGPAGAAVAPSAKFSWPFIGESVKNCCWITGSTDAATEFVESATLRRTFRAIQSLRNRDKKHDYHN